MPLAARDEALVGDRLAVRRPDRADAGEGPVLRSQRLPRPVARSMTRAGSVSSSDGGWLGRRCARHRATRSGSSAGRGVERAQCPGGELVRWMCPSANPFPRRRGRSRGHRQRPDRSVRRPFEVGRQQVRDNADGAVGLRAGTRPRCPEAMARPVRQQEPVVHHPATRPGTEPKGHRRRRRSFEGRPCHRRRYRR